MTQSEIAWFGGDQWSPATRLTLDLGVRLDSGQQVTGATHAAPRAGFIFLLTGDGRDRAPKGGWECFYDRVPTAVTGLRTISDRTVWMLGPSGQASSSTYYQNQIVGGLHNPESVAWNAAIERQVLERACSPLPV